MRVAPPPMSKSWLRPLIQYSLQIHIKVATTFLIVFKAWHKYIICHQREYPPIHSIDIYICALNDHVDYCE